MKDEIKTGRGHDSLHGLVRRIIGLGSTISAQIIGAILAFKEYELASFILLTYGIVGFLMCAHFWDE